MFFVFLFVYLVDFLFPMGYWYWCMALMAESFIYK